MWWVCELWVCRHRRKDKIKYRNEIMISHRKKPSAQLAFSICVNVAGCCHGPEHGRNPKNQPQTKDQPDTQPHPKDELFAHVKLMYKRYRLVCM